MGKIKALILTGVIIIFAAGCGQSISGNAAPQSAGEGTPETGIIIKADNQSPAEGTEKTGESLQNPDQTADSSDEAPPDAEKPASEGSTTDEQTPEELNKPAIKGSAEDEHLTPSPSPAETVTALGETPEASPALQENQNTSDTGSGVIAESDNTVSNAEKEELLQELEKELDSLLTEINKMEDLEDSDLVIE